MAKDGAPRSVDADRFRAAMARWATGVTIVTARAGARIHGMTVSDFAGVSLDPPLVLVCADKSSHTHEVIAEGGCFAVNFLAAGQEALSNRFASKAHEWERFDGLACGEAATGAPLIPGALVALDCRVAAAHDAGDHVIYVGRVEAIAEGEGEPLVYYAGAYRALAARPA
jgi:flavin reductase (DIM6/NTAB) family NADH-FMN oxidoreductase RutF